jgi:hypothetical protein
VIPLRGAYCMNTGDRKESKRGKETVRQSDRTETYKERKKERKKEGSLRKRNVKVKRIYAAIMQIFFLNCTLRLSTITFLTNDISQCQEMKFYFPWKILQKDLFGSSSNYLISKNFFSLGKSYESCFKKVSKCQMNIIFFS